MDTEDHYSDSNSDYSECKRSNKRHTYTDYSNSKYATYDKHEQEHSAYSEEPYQNDSHDSYDRKHHQKSDSYCEEECGLKQSYTPIGVWNLQYVSETAPTTDGTQTWINQLMLNGDQTLNLFASPDVGTNPLPCQVTPGLGNWEMVSDRKMKLDIVHIGYNCGDGATRSFIRIHMVFKLNRKGTRLRFCGEARTYETSDLKMCTRDERTALCFTGCGVKVLEPRCD